MVDAAGAAEIAASLTVDQIPVKLRCAACSQLASNAYKMPCCDQSICESCQQALDDACPICLHEPVKGDDCKINKALRNTIKAFLRKKGIERDQALKKELASRAPATPATPDNTTLNDASNREASRASAAAAECPAEPSVQPPPDACETSVVSKSADGLEQKLDGRSSSSEAQMDIPRPSIESRNADTPATNGSEQADRTKEQQDHVGNEAQAQQVLGGPDGQPSQEEMKKIQEQWAAMNGSMNGGYGYDGILGGFPNMAFNNPADYTQMMQYMNGMQNGLTGTFAGMMTMPDMGMNPMAMAQGMYGGYNGQGMGMNGMNSGMGYSNGQGTYGGYNAAWNGGQHNYNQNAYGGHASGMVGDYGSNAGYGGYNMPPHQGNFNQMNHRNFPNNEYQNGYHGQSYQNRGRGRGRGYQNYGRGRGAYNQVNSGNQANNEAFNQQLPSQFTHQEPDHQATPQLKQQEDQSQAKVVIPRDAETETAEAQKLVDDFSRSLEPGDAEDHVEVPNAPTTEEEPSNAAAETSASLSQPEKPSAIDSNFQEKTHEDPSPIETLVTSEPPASEPTKPDSTPAATTAMLPPPSPAVPTGPAALSSADQSQVQDYSPRGRGRGYHVVGVGSRGGSRGRGSGFLHNGISVHVPSAPPASTPAVSPVIPKEPKGLGVVGAPTGPKAMRENLSSNGVNGGKGFSIVGRASAAAQAHAHEVTGSRSPSLTRSRSRSPTRSHRHRHHRHRSTDSSHSSGRDRKRDRHHHRSRKHDDGDKDEEDNYDSRAVGSLSRRSSHRHRDDDKEKDSGRSNHRSHRSHRDRSKERDVNHRSSRKRSRSPEDDIYRSNHVNGVTQTNGASHVNGVPPTGPKADREKKREEELTHSSHKKRERGEDDDYDRDRKRSKPDHSESFENGDNHRSTKRAHREDTVKSSRKASQATQDMAPGKPQPQPPPTPKSAPNPHELEREARNRERMQKEMQRRSAADTKSTGPKRKMSGVASGGRRVSYKYEDEESSEARTSRVESEREASRWG